MQMYPDNSEVQKWACAAIQVYASKSIGNKQQLMNEGAHTLVLAAIQLNSELTHDNNAEVISWACKALIALLTNSISMRCMLRSTDIKAIIEAAKATHHSYQELVTLANEVLSKLIPQIPTGFIGTHYYALQYVYMYSCMYDHICVCITQTPNVTDQT
jgi:hypothetical protein